MAEMRSADIERYLRDVNFPANKRDIVEQARRQNAPNEVVMALDKLPDQRFNSSMDVTRGMGSSSMGSSGMGSSTSRSGSQSKESR
jgi:hypothetical protein